MDNPGPSIYLALLLLLLFSAFFSASETAISSINKVRLKNRADSGDTKAQRALHNAEDYDKTLSAILIGNNVVNITTSSLATVLCTTLMGESGVAIATIIVTILVLIFGEILPKSFAKEHAETFALAAATPLSIIKVILTPLVWIFVKIKLLFTGLRTPDLNVQPSVTEDELKTIIETVEEEGVLNSQETEIIQSAIEFDDITVQEILVPRVDIVAVNANADSNELIDACIEEGYSRIPVYEDTIDNIIGVVHAKDILECMAKNKDMSPKKIMHDVSFVYRTKHINELLAEFRAKKQHMAIVTDEHGGTLGLVTMEDVLEELVGEIWDESDESKTSVRLINKDTYLVSAEENIYDVFEKIGIDDRNFESESSTAAGWVLDNLKHIPDVGESFDYNNITITVTVMDEQRIEELCFKLANEEQ